MKQRKNGKARVGMRWIDDVQMRLKELPNFRENLGFKSVWATSIIVT